MVAANAQIGAARSLYFPEISLRGVAGYQSSALTGLFSGPAGFWTFGSCLAQPIFTAGRLRSNVRLAEAQQQEAVLFYQETIQYAFRDVADALIAYRKTQEFSHQQKLLVDSAQDATRLSHLRYSGGATSYLEVLTNDTNYFTAELNLVQARLNGQLALVQLYKRLGEVGSSSFAPNETSVAFRYRYQVVTAEGVEYTKKSTFNNMQSDR